MKKPLFPDFKPVALEDRETIHKILREYRPEISELSFTNLYIWRANYGLQWSMAGDHLLIISERKGLAAGLEPVGPAPRAEHARRLLEWLKKEKGMAAPTLERVDRRFVEEITGLAGFSATPVRDFFDYLYRTENLIKLPGRKYHAKKNHISKFNRLHQFDFSLLDAAGVKNCLEMAERWCASRRCEEDMDLTEEHNALHEALEHYDQLQLTGGLITIAGRVEAFAVGELLNPDTAVIHIEKADPEIPGLYALINQQCAENCFGATTWINREEDLGEEGLRKAKLSYHPDRLVEKYRVTLT